MAVIQHGLETYSESAGKLLSAMGIRVSGDTVLRDMHRMPIPPHHEAKAIGVDDWAFRKGVTYGSIIVSLCKWQIKNRQFFVINFQQFFVINFQQFYISLRKSAVEAKAA